MSNQQDLKPDHCTSYFSDMAHDWGIVSALLGGTRRLREAGKAYLPQHESETDAGYKARLQGTTLLNVFGSTVTQMTSQAFANPVTVDDLPSDLDYVQTSIDGRGKTVSDFGRRIFDCALKRGECFILVDMPSRGDEERNRRDSMEANRQPYAVFINPSQMLAYQSEIIQGQEVVTYARWKHTAVEREGDFGEVEKTYVTEWTDTDWRRWEKPTSKEQDWSIIGEGTHDFSFESVRAVPIVHLSFSEPGDDGLRRPPLMDLADKNVEHWQSSSDQRNILTFSRFPILMLAGVSGEDVPNSNGKAALGPQTLIMSNNKDAKGDYLEPSGAAIAAGERDLDRLERAMALLAAQPYISRPGSITATQTALEEGKSSSIVEHWVELTAQAVARIIAMMGAWRSKPVKVAVRIKPEFAAMTANAEKVKALIEARRNGDISRRQFWIEMKALDFVSDGFDFEANEAGLTAEGEGGFEDVAA